MADLNFKPAWWLRNSHLQTIFPALCRRRAIPLPLERQRLELPDGDFIDLDWVGRDRQGPTVIILHGFEGSIDSHYSKGMLQSIYHAGWRGVFMHFRGCSGEHNRLIRGYHSGDTSDLAYIVNWLRHSEKATSIAALGYSLGGNVLLKWLGETGSANPLTAAIAVSVPFELHKACQHIQKGFARVYQWYLIKAVRLRLAKKFQYLPQSAINPAQVRRIRTLYELDHHVTVPLHGFSSVEEYYAHSSSRQYLSNIAIPTLIVHAKDDPFMTDAVIPQPHELSQHVQLEVTSCGGHVGFVSGTVPWRPQYWLEQRIPQFLKNHF